MSPTRSVGLQRRWRHGDGAPWLHHLVREDYRLDSAASKEDKGVMQKTTRVLAVLLLVLVGFLSPQRTEAFSEIIVIGDSLSDAGDLYIKTGGFAPLPPYWNGRFSNGTTWVEDLAVKLGLPTPTPSLGALSNRTDYAFGGAHTDTNDLLGLGVGMAQQVTMFQTDLTNSPSWDVSQALFVVWGGANDYMNYLDNGGALPLPVSNLTQRVEELIGLGAKNFLTCNLPALGDTPKYRGTAKEATANSLSQQFAIDWRLQVNALSASNSQCAFYYFDVYSAFQNMLTNPAAYGFSNVTDPAYDGTTVVSNPDEYLFWDHVHPTRVGHELLATEAYAIVPEPGSMMLLLLALPVLVRRCWKS